MTVGLAPGADIWDFRTPAGKQHCLTLLRRAFDEMVALTADPQRWHAPTACPGWELRDMIGHLLDATEQYLEGFERARTGRSGPDPVRAPGWC